MTSTYTVTEARAILTARRDMRPIAANAIHRLHAEGWTNPAIADQLRTVTASGVRVFLNRTTPDPAHPDHTPGRTPAGTLDVYGEYTMKSIPAMRALRGHGVTYRTIAAYAGYANGSSVHNRLHHRPRQNRI